MVRLLLCPLFLPESAKSSCHSKLILWTSVIDFCRSLRDASLLWLAWFSWLRSGLIGSPSCSLTPSFLWMWCVLVLCFLPVPVIGECFCAPPWGISIQSASIVVLHLLRVSLILLLGAIFFILSESLSLGSIQAWLLYICLLLNSAQQINQIWLKLALS